MANTHSTLISLFSDIADAIRNKAGNSEQIVADNFPDAINAISTGIGGRDITVIAQATLKSNQDIQAGAWSAPEPTDFRTYELNWDDRGYPKKSTSCFINTNPNLSGTFIYYPDSPSSSRIVIINIGNSLTI